MFIAFSAEKNHENGFFYKCQRMYIYLGKNLVVSDRNFGRENDFSIFLCLVFPTPFRPTY